MSSPVLIRKMSKIVMQKVHSPRKGLKLPPVDQTSFIYLTDMSQTKTFPETKKNVSQMKNFSREYLSNLNTLSQNKSIVKYIKNQRKTKEIKNIYSKLKEVEQEAKKEKVLVKSVISNHEKKSEYIRKGLKKFQL